MKDRLPEEEEKIIPKDPELIKKVEEICGDKHPFKHIQAMDYPRMAGTPENDRATDYITTVFKDFGFDPEVEQFYLPEPSKIPKLVLPILLIGWGIFSFYNVLFISGIWGYIFGFFILLLPVIAFLVILKLEVLFKKMITGNFDKIVNLTKQIEEGTYKKPVKKGKNIYVEYVPEEYEKHLYITAHHDSTTLKLNMKFMKIFMLIGFLSGIGYVLSYLVHYLLLIFSKFNLFGKYTIIFFILLIIFLISIGLVLFSRIFRTNESHGAIDNLTGTSIILELANIVKLVKPKLKITFIVFAAEEVGLFGSAYHFNIHKKYFETHQMHVVSIDMIGEIPPLTLVDKIKPALSIPMHPEFNKQMVELAQKLGIEIKLGRFLYPGSDFANWLLNGYPANWLVNASKYLHSPQDVPKNVNQDLLIECLKLFTAYFLTKNQ
ncbi:MAG: M28 family peptidase [Candidatus Helarchaeota archaeon]|nr:M28 family peptidase [Candidatus Helarchaeota archaeon]